MTTASLKTAVNVPVKSRDKYQLSATVGRVHKHLSGDNAKISVDCRIQLSLVCEGLMRRFRIRCYDAMIELGRKSIDDKIIIRVLREMCTKETHEGAESAIGTALTHYRNTTNATSRDRHIGSETLKKVSISHSARLCVSPNLCKRLWLTDDRTMTVHASIAIAAYIEYIICLFLRSAPHADRNVVRTSDLIAAISNEGLLRDFVLHHRIYFCGGGIAVLTAHGAILQSVTKHFISMKHARRIISALLNQQHGQPTYKIASSAVYNLFAFVETRVINILRDVLFLVERLGHSTSINPLHISHVAEVKGVILREPLCPIAKDTSDRMVKAAGCKHNFESKNGETQQSVVSTLIEAVCIDILDKTIAAMDYSSNTTITSKYIREGAYACGYILASYLNPKKHALTKL